MFIPMSPTSTPSPTDRLMRDPDTLARFYLTAGMGCSHFYDLRGPSLMVDIGCSTTLTLLHLACQRLRARRHNRRSCGDAMK